MAALPLEHTIADVLTVLRGDPAEPPRLVGGIEMIRAARRGAHQVYPALARLERTGWVVGAFEPEPPDRPARRFYRLTEAGAREAEGYLRRVRSELPAERVRWARKAAHEAIWLMIILGEGTADLLRQARSLLLWSSPSQADSFKAQHAQVFVTRRRLRNLRRTLDLSREESPMTPDHSRCHDELRAHARESGMDVDVHTVRPERLFPHQPEEYTCPHGVLFWITPTTAQTQAWEGHESCAEVIRLHMEETQGIQVHVAEECPQGVFLPLERPCPHGKDMWVWPTDEQMTRWREEGKGT